MRNTELAQEARPKATIAAPILTSAVARDLKSRQEKEERQLRVAAADSQSKDEIISAAEQCRTVLGEILEDEEAAASKGVIVSPSEVVRDLLVQAQLAEAQLAEAVAATGSGEQKSESPSLSYPDGHALTCPSSEDRAVSLGDDLSNLLDRAKRLYDRQPQAPALIPTPTHAPATPNAPIATRHDHLSSPSFSIADSDDEAEDESTAASSHPATSPQKLELSTLGSDLVPEHALDLEDANSSPRSPLESQSRSFTLEEGEVFRKGSFLGVDEDDAVGDVSGEELKKEVSAPLLLQIQSVTDAALRMYSQILETEVQRSPRPSFSSTEALPTTTTVATDLNGLHLRPPPLTSNSQDRP